MSEKRGYKSSKVQARKLELEVQIEKLKLKGIWWVIGGILMIILTHMFVPPFWFWYSSGYGYLFLLIHIPFYLIGIFIITVGIKTVLKARRMHKNLIKIFSKF